MVEAYLIENLYRVKKGKKGAILLNKKRMIIDRYNPITVCNTSFLMIYF